MSEIKIRIGDILSILNALNALDGYNSPTATEADGKTVAKVPYGFDAGTRWNIAKNKKILVKELELAEEQRQGLVKELSPVNLDVSKEPAEVQTAFQARYREFFATETAPAGLLALKRAKLLPETGPQNPIPPSTLEALMPIISEDA